MMTVIAGDGSICWEIAVILRHSPLSKQKKRSVFGGIIIEVCRSFLLLRCVTMP